MRSEFVAGWPTLELRALARKVRSGATPRGGAGSYAAERSNYALVRSQNVFDHRFESNGLAFISDSQARDLAGAELEAGDVLLNITGDGVTFGRACLVPPDVLPACVNQHVMLIRVNSATCAAGYLASWLSLPDTKGYIESFNAGGSRRAITKGHIEAFQVPLPPIEVQCEIASFADTVNRRIDLLRETNATLESIAQALFKSWFIDFDPVRAKAEGREPEGMDATTAALFPAEFEESALGLIPKDWRVSTLAEHVLAERGLSYKGTGLCGVGEGLPMHNLNSVLEGGGYKYAGIKHYSGDYKDRHIAVAGDVIVANTEQGHEHRLIGFPAIVPARYERAIFSHHIYRVRTRPDSPLTTHVLYHTLMAPAVREQVIGCANGSTVNMLKVAGLEIPQFVCPTAGVAKTFEEMASPLRQQMEANVERAEVLSALRDALLPRLISGKLRIPEAQAQLEEALA
jgi:type I restriction enzyme, S subunit